MQFLGYIIITGALVTTCSIRRKNIALLEGQRAVARKPWAQTVISCHRKPIFLLAVVTTSGVYVKLTIHFIICLENTK